MTPTDPQWNRIWQETIDTVPPCSVCGGELVLAKRELVDAFRGTDRVVTQSIWRCPKCWEGVGA